MTCKKVRSFYAGILCAFIMVVVVDCCLLVITCFDLVLLLFYCLYC